MVLRPGFTGGYPYVNLSRNGVIKPFRVHRLVALALEGGTPFGRPHVDHINVNTGDADISNLQWVSHAENLHLASLRRNDIEDDYPEIEYQLGTF